MEDIPLGIGYLASILKKNGMEANIYNADYSSAAFVSEREMTKKFQDYLKIQHNPNHEIWQEIKKVVSFFKPDVVGLTSTTGKFTSAVNVARVCKEIDPKIKIVVGGAHASCLPEDTIKNKFIDFLIRGEGENTFVELAKILKDGSTEDLKKCLGLIYKINGNIINNPDRPLIEKLDDLPFPLREFYINEKDVKKPSTEGIVFATRGCPYHCIFCASHIIWTRKVRYRTPENIIAEIEDLKKRYGLRYIRFDDDSFTLNPNFVTKICDLMIKKKLRMDWYCSTRIDILNKELLEKMKKAGCIKINLGVESGNDETLKKIKKGINKEQIKKAFQVAKKVDIYTGAYVMIGFPWETEEDMLETIKFVISLKPGVIVFSIATPYPNTELYDISSKMGVLPTKINWEEFFHQSPNIILTKMDKKKFYEVVDKIEYMINEYNRKARLHKVRNPRYILKIMKRFRKNPKMLFEIGKNLIKKESE